jgi:hypothetical protein
VTWNLKEAEGKALARRTEIAYEAGARIESDVLIDGSQDPPRMNLEWIARELNYGALLKQAGFAETVEGAIDVTLRLSGSGRTRREFLHAKARSAQGMKYSDSVRRALPRIDLRTNSHYIAGLKVQIL